MLSSEPSFTARSTRCLVCFLPDINWHLLPIDSNALPLAGCLHFYMGVKLVCMRQLGGSATKASPGCQCLGLLCALTMCDGCWMGASVTRCWESGALICNSCRSAVDAAQQACTPPCA
jgi:hypothetical protein